MMSAPDRIIGYSSSLFGKYENASDELEAASASYQIDSFPTIELTYAPNSKIVQDMVPYQTFLVLTNPETHYFVVSVNEQMDSTGEVTVVVTGYGVMAYLRNTIQPWKEFHNTTPADFFADIINNHNNMADESQKFVVGQCNVTNSTDNVYRFLDDTANTLDTINDKLVSRLGGRIIVRIDSNSQSLIIDYVMDSQPIAKTAISLGNNMLASGRLLDGADLYNAIKPLGATIDSGTTTSTDNQEVSSPRLTISSVNGGVDYIVDQNAKKGDPLIVHSQTWDDVTDANILLSKARDALAQATPVVETISASALDISLIQGKPADLVVGSYVRVINKLIGLDTTLQLSAVTIDPLNPANNQYTFGDLPVTIIAMTQELKQYADAQDQIKRQQQLAIIRQQKTNEQAEADRKALQDQNAKLTSDLADTTRRLNDYINSHNNGGGGGDVNGAIIDVSEFQGDINWPLVKTAGLAITIDRVQDGSDYIDKKYIQNLQGALANDLNYAVYAFFRASSNSDAATEATNFYNRTQSVVSGKKQPRFYMLDVETVEMGGSNAAMRGGVEAYMNQLNALGIPDSKIVLYIANQLYTQLNLNVDRAGSIMIPAYGSIPNHPYDLHQYTSAGQIAGISTNVDMSNGASERFINQYIK